MLVCEAGGNARQAVTFYKVLERFRGFTSVQLFPHTGRTHQLRVHMQHIGHPIVADRLYGGRIGLWQGDLVHSPNAAIERNLHNPDLLIGRQALHALRLEFDHPENGQRLVFEAPLPADFERTLVAIREHCRI
jgi:23S rRNA pseudouridine1911/1915/1917 synthase